MRLLILNKVLGRAHPQQLRCSSVRLTPPLVSTTPNTTRKRTSVVLAMASDGLATPLPSRGELVKSGAEGGIGCRGECRGHSRRLVSWGRQRMQCGRQRMRGEEAGTVTGHGIKEMKNAHAGRRTRAQTTGDLECEPRRGQEA